MLYQEHLKKNLCILKECFLINGEIAAESKIYFEFSIRLCSLEACRQKASSRASINCGKGFPSVSIARKGKRESLSRIDKALSPAETVLNFSLRTDSATREGIQPNGPMEITPQDGDMISCREAPTVRIASPVSCSEI